MSASFSNHSTLTITCAAGRPVSQHVDRGSPRAVRLWPCWCTALCHAPSEGGFCWSAPSWLHRAWRVRACGHGAPESAEGEQFLLPAVNSSSAAEARAENRSPEPSLCSCFLSSRPLLLVLLSSETREFPSFIYIITLKVFIDCDWGPLSLLSLRLCKFSSRSLSSHILPSNSSIASSYFL